MIDSWLLLAIELAGTRYSRPAQDGVARSRQKYLCTETDILNSTQKCEYHNVSYEHLIHSWLITGKLKCNYGLNNNHQN